MWFECNVLLGGDLVSNDKRQRIDVCVEAINASPRRIQSSRFVRCSVVDSRIYDDLSSAHRHNAPDAELGLRGIRRAGFLSTFGHSRPAANCNDLYVRIASERSRQNSWQSQMDRRGPSIFFCE